MKNNIAMKKINGFTLVEMLVSLAIFVTIIAIVGGIYTTFVQKQRDQLGMQNVQQDVQNFFDTLEREVRTGYGDQFALSPAPTPSLHFFNQGQIEVTYDKSGGKITRKEASGTPVAITSDRTWIQELKFIVPSKSDGTTSVFNGGVPYLTGMPTRVTVLVKACVDKDEYHCISAQTSLSVRQLGPMPLP
jgi:prepilin-type N-terminal cleavage/methylation domain-containing protein